MSGIGPFWRYYGGKFRAAPRYPLPEIDTIIEPFAGAAGYACRYPSLRVILVDADPAVAATWRYLIRTPASEIAAIPDVPEGGSVDDLPVCQEARLLAGWWMNSGTTTPRKTPSKRANYASEGQGWGGWCRRSRERIARGVDHIRHWQIIEGDYTKAPDVRATWLIDPPYQSPAGRCYRKQPGSFDALGAWALERKGQVIACDQEGSDWMPWTGRVALKSNAGHKRDGVSREVIYHRSTHPNLWGVM